MECFRCKGVVRTSQIGSDCRFDVKLRAEPSKIAVTCVKKNDNDLFIYLFIYLFIFQFCLDFTSLQLVIKYEEKTLVSKLPTGSHNYVLLSHLALLHNRVCESLLCC